MYYLKPYYYELNKLIKRKSNWLVNNIDKLKAKN